MCNDRVKGSTEVESVQRVQTLIVFLSSNFRVNGLQIMWCPSPEPAKFFCQRLPAITTVEFGLLRGQLLVIVLLHELNGCHEGVWLIGGRGVVRIKGGAVVLGR